MAIFSPPRLLDGPRWAGMRIGLLGGSFNPPHEGHVHISQAAMKGLQLDAVWWLVTPQNPLKVQSPMPLSERMRLCKALVTDSRIVISDLEREFGTNITYETIKRLKQRFSKTDFVWISGMDNALTLHTWNRWRDLLDEICMVHLTRNPARSLVKACPLRLFTQHKHVVIDKGGPWPLDSGTTYWMMQKRIVHISSTEIRETNKNNGLASIST